MRPSAPRASRKLSARPDLSALSPRQREIYELVVVDGLTATNAAKRLGVERATVVANRSRIDDILRGTPPAPHSKTAGSGELQRVADLRGVPGEILRASRAGLDWSHRKAAKEMGLSTVTLSQLETGVQRHPKRETSKAILGAFERHGVTIWSDGGAFWIRIETG